MAPPQTPAFEHVRAVSFDFYNTLIFPCRGQGRGPALIAYLAAHGFEPKAWEHEMLYDIFEEHDGAYDPGASPQARSAYHATLARRAMGRVGVPVSLEVARRHASPLWRILGPASFGVFPEAPGVLRSLRNAGFPLVMISNWQRGLRHLVAEMGLDAFFDRVFGSADLGIAKPAPEIFSTAAAHLGVDPGEILHVGDTPLDDCVGGAKAGFQTLLLDRAREHDGQQVPTIHALDELLPLILPFDHG